MRIEGKHVVLRDLEHKDAENLFRIAHEPDIAKFMPEWSDGKNAPSDYCEMIARLQEQKDCSDLHSGKYCAIVRPDRDDLIGVVGMGIHADLNEAEISYFLSDAHKGCGYTKEAVNLLTDWCLKQYDLPYLIMALDESNASACRLAEKCGFTLCEKRVTIHHRLPNLLGDVYYYYRKY